MQDHDKTAASGACVRIFGSPCLLADLRYLRIARRGGKEMGTGDAGPGALVDSRRVIGDGPTGSPRATTTLRFPSTASRFQFALQFVEEAPVGVFGNDLLGARFD